MARRKPTFDKLNSCEQLEVQRKAHDIFQTIIANGGKFYECENDYHYLWFGPDYTDPAIPQSCDLCDWDDIVSVEDYAYSKGGLFHHDRRLWRAIAIELQAKGLAKPVAIPHDPRLTAELTQCRGKRYKRITADLYMRDLFYFNKI